MKKENPVRLLVLALILLAGGFIHFSQRALSYHRDAAAEIDHEEDIYLPDTSYLKFISLGHDNLIADVVLAEALVYYGSHYYQRRTFTFKHQKKLFFTALEMDPLNRDAFILANNILCRIDVRDAIEALELGMKHHPDYWKFPELIGFNYFYYLNDPYTAARYYEQAARLPGHPPYVPSLSGKLYSESGYYEDAVRVLHNFYSTTDDPRLKKSFRDTIDTIKAQIRQRQFQLRAVIEGITDAVTVTFKPDPDNPQFRNLKKRETLRLVGVRWLNADAAGEKEKLFARWQVDFARFALKKRKVTIYFERRANGRLKRDHAGRLQGWVKLSYNNKLFQVMAVEKGILKFNKNYPIRDDYRRLLQEAENRAVKNKPGLLGFPPETFEIKDINRFPGKVVTLRYRVLKTEKLKGDFLLHSGSDYRNPFTAVIPWRYAWKIFKEKDISDFKSLEKKWVTVTGFTYPTDRQLRMNIYLPAQLSF